MLLALHLPAGASGTLPEPAAEPDSGAPQTSPALPPSAPAPPPAPEIARPHLFLYLVDGMTTRNLTAFGYDRLTTPSLGRLMRDGVPLISAYAVSPWTVPAITSMLTSLYPSAHGVQRAGDRLPAAARTLAEVLKENGYDTALFTAHPLVGKLSGLGQGFDRIEEVPGPFGRRLRSGPGESAAALNARILEWLDRRTAKSPTFIMALTEDLMEPFGTPGPDGSHFISDEEREWYARVRKKLMALHPGPLGLATSDDLRRLQVDAKEFARAYRNLYDSALYYTDRQIATLRAELDSRGYWSRALFAVASTHGEEMGERGAFGHGFFLYDSSVRVPVVVSYPSRFRQPVPFLKVCDMVDLMPTLLSLLEVPVPEGIQGIERNLRSDEVGRIFPNRPAFAESAPAGRLPTGRAVMAAQSGAKLILYEEPPAGFKRPELELFRSPDPNWEFKNSIVSDPGLASEMRSVLEDWRNTLAKPRFLPEPPPDRPEAGLREVLRALGYLQGPEPAQSAPSKAASGKTPGGNQGP